MPHVIIEYTANLEEVIDMQHLVDTVHTAVVADGIASVGAVRTRAARRDHWQIADADPSHAMVAIYGRLGPGRDAETKTRLLNCLLDTTEEVIAPVYDRVTVALSAEIQEIDAAFRINRNHVKTKVEATGDGN